MLIVKLVNIKAIKEAVFELDEKGLYLFTGENSNGKSILPTTLGSVAKLRFLDKSIRNSFISDWSQTGDILLNRDNMGLIVHLDRDTDQCYYALTTDGTKDTLVRRYFREGGLEELVEEFGFVVFDNKVVLQLYETFGLLPFVNCGPQLDGSIVKASITDTIAEQFLKNYKEVTYKKATEEHKVLKNKLATLQATKDSMPIYDCPAYKNIYNKMLRIYNILKHLEVFELEQINLVPNVKFIDIPNLQLQEIPFIKTYPTYELPQMGDELYNYITLLNGKCPTCGKPLYMDGCKNE